MSGELLANGKVTLRCGDCLEVMAALDECSIDSAVTDPPYHLTSIVRRFGAENATLNKDYGGTGVYKRSAAGFMGKQWDGGDIAFRPETWALVYRALKPGGHLIAFAGTRQYHRMACAIEDAGFEIRDQLAWAYGSGFPKSHNVGKGIDKKFGAEREKVRHEPRASTSGTMAGSSDTRPWIEASRAKGYHEVDGDTPVTDLAKQWDGWGTALKPAWEPICLARKPLIGTVVENVLAHGTGAINIDGCRIGEREARELNRNASIGFGGSEAQGAVIDGGKGRFPANIIHDGSDEVVAAFPNEDGVSAARFFACFPNRGDECLSTKHANDAAQLFEVQSEHVVSVLTLAVEASTPRLALSKPSFRAHSTTVTASELREIEILVIEMIQNLERRFWLGLPQEKLTLSNSRASIAAIQSQTGTITITISLSKSNGFAELATFNSIPLNWEHGEKVSPSRVFYSAKADSDDRLGSKHPTVKPVDLMQYLVRLVTPPGGTVLDCFAGTGTTGEAAFREGMRAVLIEREAEYQNDIRRRMTLVLGGRDERKHASLKAAGKVEDAGPLFASL